MNALQDRRAQLTCERNACHRNLAKVQRQLAHILGDGAPFDACKLMLVQVTTQAIGAIGELVKEVDSNIERVDTEMRMEEIRRGVEQL